MKCGGEHSACIRLELPSSDRVNCVSSLGARGGRMTQQKNDEFMNRENMGMGMSGVAFTLSL